MDIAIAALPRVVNIEGRKFRLSPPTVCQAAEMLHTLEHKKDASDSQLLIELVSDLDWRPAADINIMLRNAYQANPMRLSLFIQHIILQGYHQELPEPDHGATAGADHEADSTVDWQGLLALYCRAFPGSDPYTVWTTTPFSFFMYLIRQARKEIALSRYYQALCANAGFGGNQDLMRSWSKIAGLDEELTATEHELTREVTEEEIASNRVSFLDGLRA